MKMQITIKNKHEEIQLDATGILFFPFIHLSNKERLAKVYVRKKNGTTIVKHYQKNNNGD